MPTSSALDAFAKDPPAYLPPPEDLTVVDDRRFHLTVAADGARTVWITDGRQEAELRALGCRDQDPPLTSYITALAADAPPPEVGDVAVRKVEGEADERLALELYERGWGVPRPPGRTSGDWIAYLDGEPVACAGAVAGPHGLFLTGGVT